MEAKSPDKNPLIPPAPNRVGLLNHSLTVDQLLCIEYVCEFGLGISKERIRTEAKDPESSPGRELIFDALYSMLPPDDAPSLLRLILDRLGYSTGDDHIKENILQRLPVMKKSDKEVIYRKYPKFEMWLTLTVAMTSMSDNNYRVLKNHLRHKVLSGYSETGITSSCHLLELMKDQSEPYGFDPNNLRNVLKWFRGCGLNYPKEIVDYQKRHRIPVPTHWEICCKKACYSSFCLSIVTVPTFICILLFLTLPNFPLVTNNDTYSRNHSVGVRTTVKIGEVYSSNVVKKLQIEALRNANGFYANGTVIHQVQENDFNVSSKELQHVNRAYTFIDEVRILLPYYNFSSPLYNADGLAIVNFSFNFTNNNGTDCAVRMATFGSHDDYIKYYHSNPTPRDTPLNAYNYTPCLNESGTYSFSLTMKRDAFSFFVVSHIMNISLTVNISGNISEYLIRNQESSCILNPSCSDIIISEEECTSSDSDDSDDSERWYIFGTSSSSFRGEVNLTVYPLCDEEYRKQYLAASVVPGFVSLLLLVVCGLGCIVCSCIRMGRKVKKSTQTRKRSYDEPSSRDQAV